MERILVATDFSPRSDRALRRASLLAKRHAAALVLVHVVDDELPPRLLADQENDASDLLRDMTRTLREVDGIESDAKVLRGEAFEGIARAAEEAAAELVVLGAYRRQILKEVFTGTTAERTIREARRPVLMANGVPSGPYRSVLAAIDLSPSSAEALRAAAALGLAAEATLTVAHVFDAPSAHLVSRASMTEDRFRDYIDGEEARAGRELAEFLGALEVKTDRAILRPFRSNVADALAGIAREIAADLVVVGSRGRGGAAKLLLGSVAQDMFCRADRDVLAVAEGAAAPRAARTPR